MGLLSRNLDAEIAAATQQEVAVNVALGQHARQIREQERARDRAEEARVQHERDGNTEFLIHEAGAPYDRAVNLTYSGPHSRYELWHINKETKQVAPQDIGVNVASTPSSLTVTGGFFANGSPKIKG